MLITGGATGIGRAMAEAFLDTGSEVIICGRREDRLQEARPRRPELHVKVCDLARAEDRLSLAEWVAEGRHSKAEVAVFLGEHAR